MRNFTINENGIAWVTTECGKVFGVVNASEILDEDGIRYQDKNAEEILGDYFNIQDDVDNSTQYIEFYQTNGETSILVICANGVDVREG